MLAWGTFSRTLSFKLVFMNIGLSCQTAYSLFRLWCAGRRRWWSYPMPLTHLPNWLYAIWLKRPISMNINQTRNQTNNHVYGSYLQGKKRHLTCVCIKNIYKLIQLNLDMLTLDMMELLCFDICVNNFDFHSRSQSDKSRKSELLCFFFYKVLSWSTCNSIIHYVFEKCWINKTQSFTLVCIDIIQSKDERTCPWFCDKNNKWLACICIFSWFCQTKVPSL